MKFRIALRTASILSFIHAALHQVGMSRSPAGQEEIAVTTAMQSFQMDVMGSLRSYWDLFFGMGLFLTITLVTLGAQLWILSNVKATGRPAIRPLLLVLGLAFAVFAVASMRYFFIAPLLMEAVIAALIVYAYVTSRRAA